MMVTAGLARAFSSTAGKSSYTGRGADAAGKAVGSTNQQVKGTINKNVGAAQAKFGDMKSHVKDSHDAKDAK